MRAQVPRLMIAGTASGSGKTTVTCGLLRLLSRRGLRVRACKVGPDFIDPTFHERVLGVPSRNLDLFLGSGDLACEILADGGQDADVTVIEGVMGYYDGIAMGYDASSYDVAQVTGTPVVLVADARGRALSVAAEVAGFARFRNPSQVAGVILNRVSASYYPALKEMVERETDIPVLGFVPRTDSAHLPSRHLGLVRAEEVEDLAARVDALADALQETVDVEGLLRLADTAPELDFAPREVGEPVAGSPLVAVARDDAFSFYYHDTLSLLERLGARLAYVSPLADEALPQGVCGLYLGGGYPELHAQELAANEAFRDQVREVVQGGMPTIAECGGFLYLHETLEDAEGTPWPMAGALPGRAFRREGLGRFGYVTLTAREDSLLADAGQTLPAHEFHYWESENPGASFAAQKPQSARGWDCVVATETLHAGFPHLYLGGCVRAARRFVEACAAYGASRGRRS